MIGFIVAGLIIRLLALAIIASVVALAVAESLGLGQDEDRKRLGGRRARR